MENKPAKIISLSEYINTLLVIKVPKTLIPSFSKFVRFPGEFFSYDHLLLHGHGYAQI
jgi:hypothetical protein